MLKLVPFQDVWIDHDKLDLHAIYRRPRKGAEDEYGERPVIPGEWDLTGPLPVRSHNKWAAKGYQYITLANRESLHAAAAIGTVHLQPGMHSWREYDQHRYGGPWNYRLYAENESREAAGHLAAAKAAEEKLKADVERFGWEAVEAIRQSADPKFVMPDHLKKPQGKGRAA